jgi:hypothetical protein
MDKIILEVPELSQAEINFGSQKIYVDVYLSIEKKVILLSNYMTSLYQERNFVSNYIEAEYSLILGILDFCTNIDINMSGSNAFDLNMILATGVFKDIKDKIINYSELRNDISRLIELNNGKKSIGYKFDTVADKLISFLDSLSKIDLTEAGMKKLIDNLGKEVKQLNKTIGVTQILDKDFQSALLENSQTTNSVIAK